MSEEFCQGTLTPSEMLLGGMPLNDAFWQAYYDHYHPFCPGCGERISSGKQLPPAERIKYDSDTTGKHISVCPKSLIEG